MGKDFLLAWHQPERFTLYAVCPGCGHESELYIPRLMQQHGLEEYERMEKVVKRLTCSQCKRQEPTLRRKGL